MESAYLEGDRRALEITRHVSLRRDLPSAFAELVGTGRAEFELGEGLWDGDFPGHYFRRIKTVSLTVAGSLPANSNVNCSLTLLSSRIRSDANASGSYAQSDDNDARFLTISSPIQAIATSRPGADAGVFELRFDDERYLPFEGAGAIANFRLDMRQSDNALALSELDDVVLSVSYTARTGGAALERVARAQREKGIARGGLRPAPEVMVSVRRDLPELWRKLSDAAAGAEVEATLPLDAERISGRFRGLELRIEKASVYAHARDALRDDALRVKLEPPKGAPAVLGSFSSAWPGSRTMRASADVSGSAGSWKIGLTGKDAKATSLLDDLIVVFELRARSR
jgi:hypothetical protein